jgi:hypothetical protein
MAIKYFNSSKSFFPYLALLLPFCIHHIYIFVITGQPQVWAYTLVTIMPRYIAIVFFALYFVKRAVSDVKA